MTNNLASPQVMKGGIVIADPADLNVMRVVTLQYNPHTVSRTLKVQDSSGGEGATETGEALRLKGPAEETIKVEAELDAADQLESGSPIPAMFGIQPQLAALEMTVNPSIRQVVDSMLADQQGFMEILPIESPLTLFVWSAHRVVPVRITEFSVTEEMFNNDLKPIRAKVSLGMRVLTFDDLGFGHKGGSLFFAHLIQKEILSAFSGHSSTTDMGIGAAL